MAARILFVDDDVNVLDGFRRQFRKTLAMDTAPGGKEALEVLEQGGPFSVIVSDLRMPGMDGIQFLSRARETAPESVRILLTGYADLETAIDAINQGNIFRFLTKPCKPEDLLKTISDGVRQYDLITAERELLENTLRGSVKVLSEILQLVNPEAFGRASRIRHYMRAVGKRMRVDNLWQIDTAASLSQIGCVILPQEALRKLYLGQELSGEESQLFSMHPFVASDLLANIPRMESVSEIIAFQQKNFDGSGAPADPRKGEDIPLGARILRVVLDFDTLLAKDHDKLGSVEQLKARTGLYDPLAVAALAEVIKTEESFTKASLKASELRDGMVLYGDVVLLNGRLLAPRGYKVNRTLRERLRSFAETHGIKEPIAVLVPKEPPENSGK
ncbi:MAG: response regulator [Syntrophobacteraceae bacterium]|nr:response regulator [Syntrophobacteraceae bacterium]MDR3714442.1 response regulator [Puia sp.]